MGSVSLTGVTKTFRTRRGEVPAVVGVDLEVRDGELLVLVGPSACGKTTTLRLIAGLETPDAGTIRIGDVIVNDVAPRHRDVAMVFQHYALYPHMTVYNNMGFGLKMRGHGKADIDRRVRRAAGSLDIGELLPRKPDALSAGQRQRVALGRAIVREPRVFLFDEPLTNLDVRLRRSMRALLRSLHQQLGATIIHVTHDQEEAMTLGDRIAVMNHGRILQVGTPLEVYHRPRSRFVGAFLGSAPMNFIEGVWRETDSERVLVESPLGRLRIPRHRIDQEPPPSGLKVTVGIRPEHVTIDGGSCPPSTDRTGEAASDPVEMKVAMVEPLGDRTHVHLTSKSGTKLIAIASPHVNPTPGQAVVVALDLNECHVFGAQDDGRRL